MTFADVLEIKNGRNQRAVEDPNGKYPIYGSGGIMGYANDYICDAETVIIGRKGNINKPIFVEEPFWNVDTAFGLAAKRDLLLPKYLYYFCLRYDFEKHNKTVTIPSLTKADLLNINIELPSIEVQQSAIGTLQKIEEVLNLRQQQLSALDNLIKARFVEMFGEPIANTKKLPTQKLGEICELKAGDFTAAEEIHDSQCSNYPYPCYGGNGIRGYVDNYTQDGEYPIIGRQGALCGNVQHATGKFRNTEHAVLVMPRTDLNRIWLYELLVLENLYRFHTGAAQPGLSVKTLNSIDIPIADINLQNSYAEFYNQIDKSKSVIQKSLDETQLLFDSLMQEYFG